MNQERFDIYIPGTNSAVVNRRLAALKRFQEHQAAIKDHKFELPDISNDPHEVLKPIRQGDWQALEKVLKAKPELIDSHEIYYDGDDRSLASIIALEGQGVLGAKFHGYRRKQLSELAKKPAKEA